MNPIKAFVRWLEEEPKSRIELLREAMEGSCSPQTQQELERAITEEVKMNVTPALNDYFRGRRE